jgi:hypothetical protein
VSRCGFVDIKIQVEDGEETIFFAPSHITSIQQGVEFTWFDTLTGIRHSTKEPAHTLAMRCAAATSDVGRNTNWDDVDIGASETRLCTYWRYT